MHSFFKNRYLLLFLAVLLFLGLTPFLPDNFWGSIIVTILLSIMTIQSVSIIVQKEKNFKYGFAIGFIVLAVIWITQFLETPNVEVWASNLLLFFYFGYILIMLIRHMIRNKRVDMNMIMMAITVYLLCAICGGFLFALDRKSVV